jgi:uncharacterized protein (DUF2235 family)
MVAAQLLAEHDAAMGCSGDNIYVFGFSRGAYTARYVGWNDLLVRASGFILGEAFG